MNKKDLYNMVDKAGTGCALFIVVVLILALLLGGCSANTSTENIIPENVLVENPMFVNVGDEIEIDGVKYSASSMYVTELDKIMTTTHGYFLVNRVNRHVFFVQQHDSGRNATRYAFDTGLVYDGELEVGGVPIPDVVSDAE